MVSASREEIIWDRALGRVCGAERQGRSPGMAEGHRGHRGRELWGHREQNCPKKLLWARGFGFCGTGKAPRTGFPSAELLRQFPPPRIPRLSPDQSRCSKSLENSTGASPSRCPPPAQGRTEPSGAIPMEFLRKTLIHGSAAQSQPHLPAGARSIPEMWLQELLLLPQNRP